MTVGASGGMRGGGGGGGRGQGDGVRSFLSVGRVRRRPDGRSLFLGGPSGLAPVLARGSGVVHAEPGSPCPWREAGWRRALPPGPFLDVSRAESTSDPTPIFFSRRPWTRTALSPGRFSSA